MTTQPRPRIDSPLARKAVSNYCSIMQVCEECGAEFPVTVEIGDVRLNVRGRKRCLLCRPHRPQRRPRKRVDRRPKTKLCESCGMPFPARLVIDGKVRSLYRRRFCLECSPFGIHNTSKHPPRTRIPQELREQRRRRRNAKTYRYQKRRRKEWKAKLVAAAGGKCIDCGYSHCLAALEFHHRDATTKEFGLGTFTGSWARLLAESLKCDILCASCHRIRHSRSERQLKAEREARLRRDRKARAVTRMGERCFACDRSGPHQLFEFHHLDASEKDFGISEDGIMRRWEKVIAELAKCVMLCANCHREVHAGVRELDEGLLGLAEGVGSYAVSAA